MTTQVRPPAPRRTVTLVPALAIASIGFLIGGFTGTSLQGVLWGAIGGFGLVFAMRLARVKLERIDEIILVGTGIGATVLSTIVLPDAPQELSPALALRFGGAWAVMGVGAAAALIRQGLRRSTLAGVVIGWAAAGVLAIPAAVSFDVIVPLESAVGEPEPLGSGIYAFLGLAVALIGAGGTLAAATALNSLAVGATAIFLTAYAGAQVGFTLPGLIENFGNVANIPNFWPPDFDWAIGDGNWWWLPSWEFGSAVQANPLVETFRIAVVSAVFGCGIALPVAFLASKVTSPNPPTYLIDKGFMNVIRTIPDLFWAMLFTVSLGIGPFAGALALIAFSLAIMAKLLSETIDSVDPGPLEAAKATGSRHFPAVRTSVLPQVLPNYVAYALYIFELNIRASVVLGLVGAGGIGRVLEAQRSFFRFDRVLAIVIVIFVIVFLIEQVSVALRRRLV